MATIGSVVAVEFDIKSVKYSLLLSIDKSDLSLETTPSIIFITQMALPVFRLWRHLLDFRVRQIQRGTPVS